MPRYHKRSFRCTRVVDGDTLDIDIPDGQWKTTRIRLWGVDTPETVRPNTPPQYFGPEASAFTKRLAEGETLRIELLPHDTRDKYGRLLAYVHLPDGTMLNRRLVEEGYGYADPRFEHRRQSEFRKAMTQAQEKKRGLWAHPHPVDWPDYMKKEGTEK
jgi:micrococcal nuclease